MPDPIISNILRTNAEEMAFSHETTDSITINGSDLHQVDVLRVYHNNTMVMEVPKTSFQLNNLNTKLIVDTISVKSIVNNILASPANQGMNALDINDLHFKIGTTGINNVVMEAASSIHLPIYPHLDNVDIIDHDNYRYLTRQNGIASLEEQPMSIFRIINTLTTGDIYIRHQNIFTDDDKGLILKICDADDNELYSSQASEINSMFSNVFGKFENVNINEYSKTTRNLIFKLGHVLDEGGTNIAWVSKITTNVKDAITISSVADFTPYVISRYNYYKNKPFYITGTGFNPNCVINFIKKGKTNDDLTQEVLTFDSNPNNACKVNYINASRLELEINFALVFPDLLSREFQIEIVDPTVNIPDHGGGMVVHSSERLVLHTKPFIKWVKFQKIFYNVPNTLVVQGFGFNGYDFHTGDTITSNNLLVHSFDLYYKTQNYSNKFSTLYQNNKFAVFDMQPLTSVTEDTDSPDNFDFGHICLSFFIENKAVSIEFTDISQKPYSHYNYSNTTTLNLYRAYLNETTHQVVYSPRSYEYAHLISKALHRFLMLNQIITQTYNLNPNILAMHNLVPLIEIIANHPNNPYSYEDSNGNTKTTNDYIVECFESSRITAAGSTQGLIDVAALHDKLEIPIKNLLNLYFNQLTIAMGSITLKLLAEVAAYSIIRSNFAIINNIELVMASPIRIETCPTKIYSQELPSFYDYILEMDIYNCVLKIPASIFQESFSYSDVLSDNGVILVSNMNKKLNFVTTFNNCIKEMIFKLVSDNGKYKNSSTQAGTGSIPSQFIKQVSGYLFGDSFIKAPIQNEKMIEDSINNGLQIDGSFKTIGDQVADLLFTDPTIEPDSRGSANLYALFSQLTAQSPNRFTQLNNNLTPLPILPGDIFCFYTLIGGPITTTNSSIMPNTLSIKQMFPDLCAPTHMTSPKEYLLSVDGNFIRKTKNLYKIQLI